MMKWHEVMMWGVEETPWKYTGWGLHMRRRVVEHLARDYRRE
jgi:hypothetical protein